VSEREAELREEIEAALAELARVIGPSGPEEVLAYVERLAERMRDELGGAARIPGR
jgi:hypothetical protein